MQKVVRSTLVAFLSAAALVACGDKVEIKEVLPTTPAAPGLLGVSVVGPTSYTLKSSPATTADSLVFSANVSAEAGFAGSRAVTWTSSDVNVFGINSATGRGHAKTAGSTVITATSSATNSITGTLVLQVLAPTVVTPPTTPGTATIAISSINQGVNFVGLPPGGIVDLSNIAGQVDVTVAVDFNVTNPPTGKQVVLELVPTVGAATPINCDIRSFGSSSAAASADVVNMTMSCRTAQFAGDGSVAVTASNPLGATSFKNGQYTLRACLVNIGVNTCTGVPAGQSVTRTVGLNNQDFVRMHVQQATVASGGRVATTSGLWRAGGVQVEALPILYTLNRTLGTAMVNLVNSGTDAASGALPNAVSAAARVGTVAYNAAGVTPLDIPACTGFATQTFTGAAYPANGGLTFTGGDSVSAAGVENVVVDTVTVFGTFSDAAGVSIPVLRNRDGLTAYGAGTICPASALAAGNFIRLDNRDPRPSQFDPRVANQGANDRTVTGTDPFPNAAWLGANIGSGTVLGGQPSTSLPTAGNTTAAAALAGNGLFTGSDLITVGGSTNGVNVNTVSYQFAAVGTAKTGTWTNLTSVAQTGFAPTPVNTPTTYWIRIITKDALDNADTSRVFLNYSTALGTVYCIPATPLAGQPAGCAATPLGGDPVATYGAFPAATFGADVAAPATAVLVTGGGNANNAVVSPGACTINRFAGTANVTSWACAAVALPSGTGAVPFSFTMSETSTAGAPGSFFGSAPVGVTIRRLVPHPSVPTLHVVECITPAGVVTQVPGTERCTPTNVTAAPFTLPGTAQTDQGEYSVTFTVSDEANNRIYVTGTGMTSSNTTCEVTRNIPNTQVSGTTTCLQYVIDPFQTVVNLNPVSFSGNINPAAGATTSLATSGGSFNDNLDVLGGNGTALYPAANGGAGVTINFSGSLTNVTASRTGGTTTPARFDDVLNRTADVNVPLSAPIFGNNLGFTATGTAATSTGPANIFYRSLWDGAAAASPGGKPTSFNFRVWDSGNNLSSPITLALPATNISAATPANPFVGSPDFTTFAVSAATGTGTRTFTATVTAPALSLQSPFTKVCFYLAPPSGAGNQYGLMSTVTPDVTNGTARPNFSSGSELLLAVCSDTPVVATTAGTRTYTYTGTFAVPSNFTPATAGWTYRAIGTNAAGDGILTAAIAIPTM